MSAQVVTLRETNLRDVIGTLKALVAEMEAGAYGILEPKKNCALVTAADIDFAVVPCLSFDRKGRRLGLLGMRERVEMVGGTFSIDSAPGRGTLIEVHLPSRPPVKKKAAP